MIVTLNWLNDFVDLSDKTPLEIARAFTFSGFEVDEIIEKSKGMERVFVGRIEKIDKHPSADRLQICHIDLGNEKTQIITAATNVFEGALVPCALDGANLPNGVCIKTTEMRGEQSCGMLCSGEELCIDNTVYEGAETDGIMILNENDCKVGQNIAKVIGFDDIVFDISVLSNRPDCQSVMGLAKELAVAFSKPFKMPKMTYNVSDEDLPLTVKIETENCNYIIGHAVKDVEIKPSPLWMQKRLKAVGLNAINNVVDITNYVLWEIGQPMHAFDLSMLEGNTICARQASDNDKVLALDDKDYNLNTSCLVISDDKRAISIAGIKGGKEFSILQSTKNIAFEIASFKKENIRRTSRMLGLRSDASARYERGVEPISCKLGHDRTLALIDELKIGKICKTMHAVPKLDFSNPRIIEFDISNIKKLLGIEVPQSEILRILNGLDIASEINNNTLKCTIPFLRADLQLKEDIIEEIARFYGYDKIVSSYGEKQSSISGGFDAEALLIKQYKEILRGTSANEVKTFTVVSPKNLDMILSPQDSVLRKQVTIKNPLSFDYSVMRTEMISSMLSIVKNNENYKNTDFAIYEIGKIFNVKDNQQLPNEQNVLAYLSCEKNADFFKLKQVTETVANKLNLNFDYVKETNFYMHPNICANIMIGKMVVGVIGKIHPSVLKNFDITQDCYYFELYLDKIPSKKVKKIKPMPKFPSSTRDLAIIVNDNVAVGDILKSIKKSASKDCESIEFFDVYTGNQVEEGKKSVAVRLVFRKQDGTLTVDEINNYTNNVLKELEIAFNAKLR